jgi:hypothetical protein
MWLGWVLPAAPIVVIATPVKTLVSMNVPRSMANSMWPPDELGRVRSASSCGYFTASSAPPPRSGRVRGSLSGAVVSEPVEQSILVQFSENTYAVCRTHIHQAIGYSWRNEFVASPEVVA